MQKLVNDLAPFRGFVREKLEALKESDCRWADLVYYVRHMLGCTQEELAERIQVTRVTVEYWETGRTLAGVRSRTKLALEFLSFCMDVFGPCLSMEEVEKLCRDLEVRILTLYKK